MADADATKVQVRAAIAAVRDCADTMEAQAEGLWQAMPAVSMPADLRVTAMTHIAGLRETSGRVTFELALLQAEVGEAKVDTATVVQGLSHLDAAMMAAVAVLTDVVDRLESAAEDDEAHERAFVLVIEAIGVLLQAIGKAKSATQALGTVSV